MFSTCIFCCKPLGTNPLIESCPIGQRLAFDPAKGRLWVVCWACERWNLTPFEERWEALEECERRFRSTRLRFSTANIGLARLAPGVDLVRIGAPLRPELAAWRDGDQFGRRRRRYLVTTGALLVGVPAAFLSVSAGLAAIGVSTGWLALEGSLWLRAALRTKVSLGKLEVSRTKSVHLTRHLLDQTTIRLDQSEAGWHLEIPDQQDRLSRPFVFRGQSALDALQRMLPLINHRGGTPRLVQDAVERLEAMPEPEEQILALAKVPTTSWWSGDHYELHRQAPSGRLALEMRLREELEERSMTGELWLLEREWRAAEEVAGIADNLLVDQAVSGRLESLKQKDPSPKGDS